MTIKDEISKYIGLMSSPSLYKKLLEKENSNMAKSIREELDKFRKITETFGKPKVEFNQKCPECGGPASEGDLTRGKCTPCRKAKYADTPEQKARRAARRDEMDVALSPEEKERRAIVGKQAMINEPGNSRPIINSKAKKFESWDKSMKTPDSKKGMFKGKDKNEIKSELSMAMARSKKLHDEGKKEPESLKKKIKELEFALRAKNKFGKVSESMEEDEEIWYDKHGNVSPNGAYDAGGHFYSERFGDRDYDDMQSYHDSKKDANARKMAKNTDISESTASAVAEKKVKNPELFCKTKSCLWRTGKDNAKPCPKHGKKIKESFEEENALKQNKCGDCYGEQSKMKKCNTCKGTGKKKTKTFESNGPWSKPSK